MTAAKRAKQLESKLSITDIAEAFGVSYQAMQYHYHNNPDKFDIIVCGVTEMDKRRKRQEFEKTL